MIKKITFLLIPISVIIFLSSRIFFFSPSFLETTTAYLAYPVIEVSSFLAKPFRTLFFTRQSDYKTLFKEHELLKQKFETLQQNQIKLTALSHYAKKSEDLRIFQDRYKLKNAILASALVKTITNEEHSMIVNRGSRDGIKKNMVAIYKLQLVGRVSSVTPCYSKITLITDTQSKISVYTNTSSARGIVEGSNKKNLCYLKYISHLNTVQNGDFVLSNGQGMVFPEGFCVGKIINITKQDVCYHVETTPLIDLSSIEMCLITGQEKMNLF